LAWKTLFTGGFVIWMLILLWESFLGHPCLLRYLHGLPTLRLKSPACLQNEHESWVPVCPQLHWLLSPTWDCPSLSGKGPRTEPECYCGCLPVGEPKQGLSAHLLPEISVPQKGHFLGLPAAPEDLSAPLIPLGQPLLLVPHWPKCHP
jgi:hypothetical protein